MITIAYSTFTRVNIIILLTVVLPDIGVNESMTGAGEFSPSVSTKMFEHSCITSQVPSHHPHANFDPILAAIHSEYPLANSRQSYNVTVRVCVR